MSRPAPPANRARRVSTHVFDDLLTRTERLKASPWSALELDWLPDEDCARLAYDLSGPLQREFNTVEVFLAFWRGTRPRMRKAKHL